MPSKPPSLADRPLIRAARAALRELADPEKASIIQAYMKSSMPCLGVQTPLHRAACREVFAAHPLASPVAWHDTVLALWREAEYRWRRRLDCGVLRRRPAWIFRASMIGSRRSLGLRRSTEKTGMDFSSIYDRLATKYMGRKA